MGYIRYTCNKKNEPAFREDCKRCPEYNPCARDGKWCFVGALVAEHESFITPAVQPSATGAAAPVMVKHDYRDVKIAEGTTVTIDIEEIKKRLNERLMPGFLQYGG